MSNLIKFNMPQELLINKKHIVCFNNFSFFVNLSEYTESEDNNILINKISGQNKYKFVNYDPFILVFDKNVIFLPIEELNPMRKYNNLVNIHVRLL